MQLIVFASDGAESAYRRRVRSFLETGHQVTTFTFRRSRQVSKPPDWRNIDLSFIEHQRVEWRLLRLAASFARALRHGRIIRDADVIVARNLDMLMLAHLVRKAAGAHAAIIYECLDIHGGLTGHSVRARSARALERFLLQRCQLLAVSSPAFLTHYFSALQAYTGPSFLIENKLWLGRHPPLRSDVKRREASGRPWVLGWVGSLRCRPSLDLLIEIADRLGDAVSIEMHGDVHCHMLPDFEASIAGHSNIHYHGPYEYPRDLAAIYGGCDLVWAQDLWQSGTNSDWLLPNRIYEAAYFGCLSIAGANTQTGRRIDSGALGYTLPACDADALLALLRTLVPADVEARRTALLCRPSEDFVSSRGEVNAMLVKALENRGSIGGLAQQIKG